MTDVLSPQWREDRPSWRVYAVSLFNDTPYELSGVEAWQTTKSADGDAGSFSIRAALGRNFGYARVMSPMDLIVIMATKASRLKDSSTVNADSLAPPTLHYGSAGAAQTAALAAMPACIMIGMVDQCRESINIGGTADLLVNGRDLTKIFIDNDVALPVDVPTSQLQFALSNITITRGDTARAIMLNFLNTFVSKVTSPTGEASAPASKYGYPWYRFIDVGKLTDTHLPYAGKGNYSPFTVSAGPAWGNMMELRNSPINRMYVTETGSLIFDDQWSAWTAQPPAAAISPDDLRGTAEFFQDDSLVSTFVSIIPIIATGLRYNTGIIGGLGASNKYVPGVSTPLPPGTLTSGGATSIEAFGFRWRQFQSIWDLDTDDAALRSTVVLFESNYMFRASTELRGRSDIRAGNRYTLNFGPSRPELQNATWYAESVTHEASWGQDWVTKVNWRYPFGDATNVPLLQLHSQIGIAVGIT